MLNSESNLGCFLDISGHWRLSSSGSSVSRSFFISEDSELELHPGIDRDVLLWGCFSITGGKNLPCWFLVWVVSESCWEVLNPLTEPSLVFSDEELLWYGWGGGKTFLMLCR